MPSTVSLFDRDHSAAAPAATPVARRRRRGLPHPAPVGGQAHAALQRSLDRRDNGGVTGH